MCSREDYNTIRIPFSVLTIRSIMMDLLHLKEEGASVELFKGSHLLGYLAHSTVSGTTQLAETPAECGSDGTPNVTVSLNPGDVLIYSQFLLQACSSYYKDAYLNRLSRKLRVFFPLPFFKFYIC